MRKSYHLFIFPHGFWQDSLNAQQWNLVMFVHTSGQLQLSPQVFLQGACWLVQSLQPLPGQFAYPQEQLSPPPASTTCCCKPSLYFATCGSFHIKTNRKRKHRQTHHKPSRLSFTVPTRFGWFKTFFKNIIFSFCFYAAWASNFEISRHTFKVSRISYFLSKHVGHLNRDWT